MFTTVQKTYTNPWQAVASRLVIAPSHPSLSGVTFGPLSLVREGIHKQRKSSQPVQFFKEKIKSKSLAGTKMKL